ncbi:MAG: hypothetical protein ABR968_14190 [Bacteroidales bacterium]|jgi:hypothetical protein
MKKEYYLFIIIAIGLFMRIIWTGDMEWKGDENQMYTMAHDVVNKGVLPSVGMESGGGIVNPGMSVAVFALIAEFTSNPLAMDKAVQIINVISILCFLLFIFLKVGIKEREIWLTGIVLAAISPLAVIFSRKIWAQDLLPFFSFLIVFSNANRNKGWGAFLWGIAGAIIGQIHMSGFFLAFGLFVFTLIHDHYNKIRFRWVYWIAGSLIGSIGLIPWISFLIHNPQVTNASFWHIFQFNFYIYWFLDSLGINTYYSLHKDFWMFIKEPVIIGIPTYIVAVVHLFLVTAGIFTLSKIVEYISKIYHQLNRKTFLKQLFIEMNITKFYLFAVLLGLGVFLTLSGTTICQHYLICAFPFTYIFLAKILQHHKRLMLAVIIAQMVITVCFLVYIHNNNGAIHGDYGKAYHAQTETGK